jgi:hypothetical protein
MRLHAATTEWHQDVVAAFFRVSIAPELANIVKYLILYFFS